LNPEIAEKIAVPKTLRAPFVTQIQPGSPAERAGIQPYDVITAVKNNPVHTPQELVQAITSSGIGQSIALTINRAGEERTLTLRTQQRPSSELASTESESEHFAPNPTGLMLGKAKDGKGVVVTEVEPGSSAENNSNEQFNRLVKNGKSYLLRIKRRDPEGQDSYAVVILETEQSDENG
jgi:S1-C subfamily serine protease